MRTKQIQQQEDSELVLKAALVIGLPLLISFFAGLITGYFLWA